MSHGARFLRVCVFAAAFTALAGASPLPRFSSNSATLAVSLPPAPETDVARRTHVFVTAPPPAPVADPAESAPALNVAPRVQASTFTCGVNAFCYPRLEIAGAIVPYRDCSGTTDVGTQIRSLSCVSDHYLAAHAYTQFGRIWGWRAGDVVYAYGERYVVYDAFTQQGCVKPARALAPSSPFARSRRDRSAN